MGGRLLVGVRPQDLELCAPDAGDATGHVAIVELLGAASLVHLEVEGLAEMTRVVVDAGRPVRVGDQVGLRVRPDRVHLFQDGGARVVD
jgi:ABC-type sugar transport system ATPase subunit